MNWIPTTDRLPEDCLSVWVTVVGQWRIVTKAYYDETGKTWREEDGFPIARVIAWQPIPEPYSLPDEVTQP